MAKRTLTKIIRSFDAIPIGVIKGEQRYVHSKRTVPFPPLPRQERTIMCDGEEITILVSEGQIINEAKICKKHLKKKFR